ncbi:lipopolysaccharide biosynthesis protein [Methyloversatilis discipulorum]|jgi:O-antigen/teichoic acid export membrane protein|uniref:lipopolysaccharide biosynthesis protein n=1 Tax=Methyloversatilis discipulorum TaxID=1119528 RepID=UPI003F2E9251
MSLGQSIRSSSKWLVGSALAGQGLQFAIGIVLARLLVPADFGMLVTVQMFTGFVGLVASGGLGQALIRARDATERDFQVVFTTQIGIGVAIYLVFFLIAPWFADWFGQLLYRELLRVSALTFLIRPFQNLHNIWLQRHMRFRELSRLGVLTAFIAGCSSVAMAAGGFGVWSLVLSGLLGGTLSALIVSRLTPLRARLLFDATIVRQHSAFGLKMTGNDLVGYLSSQTSNFIVTKMGGPVMVGLFNKGDSLAKLPFNIISAQIYAPIFRAMSAEQDSADRIHYLFHRAISLLLLYTLPLYLGLAWLAEPLIVTLYGQKWADAAIPLEILAPLGLLYCIGHPAGAVLGATNRAGREALVQTAAWGVVAIGCLIGVSHGLAGVAIAIAVSQLYSTSHMYLLARKAVGARTRELLRTAAPALLLNALMLVALWSVERLLPADMPKSSPVLYLMASAGAGGLVYCAGFLLMPARFFGDESLRWRRMLRIGR